MNSGPAGSRVQGVHLYPCTAALFFCRRSRNGRGAAINYQLAASTAQLARFVVFGSFVTAKAEPNDLDVVLIMEDKFDLASVTNEAALVFQHMDAQAHFGASVFWTRRAGALGGEQAMIEYWQVRREGGRRGIVEIVEKRS